MKTQRDAGQLKTTCECLRAGRRRNAQINLYRLEGAALHRQTLHCEEPELSNQRKARDLVSKPRIPASIHTAGQEVGIVIYGIGSVAVEQPLLHAGSRCIVDTQCCLDSRTNRYGNMNRSQLIR